MLLVHFTEKETGLLELPAVESWNLPICALKCIKSLHKTDHSILVEIFSATLQALVPSHHTLEIF